MNISLENDRLKQTIKQAMLEFFQENKEEFSTLLAEIIEDIALSKAIAEGEETELVERQNVFAILDEE